MNLPYFLSSEISATSILGLSNSNTRIPSFFCFIIHKRSKAKEDVTEIIMNIKSLAIKNSSETNEAKTAYIEYEGEGIVHASDIQADQDIEILNPECPPMSCCTAPPLC